MERIEFDRATTPMQLRQRQAARVISIECRFGDLSEDFQDFIVDMESRSYRQSRCRDVVEYRALCGI